jgi:hypothetical protein
MPSMMRNIFLNAEGRLRSFWWIALFFAVLAGLLVPLIVNAGDAGVPLWQQLAVIAAASLLCQALRRRPIAELTGPLSLSWARDLGVGLAGGALLMLVPAAALAALGAVSWQANPAWAEALPPVLLTLLVAAAAEELLFRGFLFQRLIDGVGVTLAQLAIAALFTLTHSGALAAQGELAYLAGANIFLASLMFGQAFVRTKSLALPFGLHFAANVTQGPLLGFGVSGSDEQGLLVLTRAGAPDWLTGGTFGLEASVPGFLAVLALTALLYALKPRTTAAP